MTYSKSTLQRIGREVLQKHPGIASKILEDMPQPKRSDIERIPVLFNSYCQVIGVDSSVLHGPVYKSAQSERKKVFISAMACIYNGTRQFSKTIAQTFGVNPSAISRVLEEVVFRYKKDSEFKTEVDNILNKLENDNRAA